MSIKDFIASQRKNYFINAKFQMKYSVLLVGLGFIISVLIGFSIIFFINETLRIFSISGLSSIPTLMEIINNKMSDLIITIIFLFAIQIICLLLIGIYTTHKICGPIYVLEKSLKKITRGSYSEKMALRKSDDFQSLPLTFNRMVDKLNTKLQEDIAFLKLLENEIDILESEKSIPKHMEEEINRIKSQAQFLREQKSYSIK